MGSSNWWVCKGARRICRWRTLRQAEQAAALFRARGESVQVRYIVPVLTYPGAEKGEGA